MAEVSLWLGSRTPKSAQLRYVKQTQTNRTKRGQGVANWIFSQKEKSQYSDTEGVVYEFPTRLPNARHVIEGDRFVYYRPKKDATDGGGYYFGMGQVERIEIEGPIRRALIKEYRRFAEPVLESDLPEIPRNNLQNSINRISDENWRMILEAGN